MIDRFKRYLEREFRAIAATQEAMDYREEILGTLLDREQEYRIKGMTDDDMIYDTCIDSLGDFRATLLDFEDKRAARKKQAIKASRVVLVALSYFLLITIGYLVLSFVTGAWSKTWLMFIAGVAVAVIVGSCIGISFVLPRKKYVLTRLFVYTIITFVFVTAYLFILTLTDIPMSWLTFLILPIISVGMDTVIAFLTKAKTKYVELLLYIPMTCALVYVILALMKVLTWSIFWLIPVFGAFVDLIILTVLVFVYVKKKKDKVKEIEQKVDYYTTWRK